MGDAFFLKKKSKPAGVAARRPAGSPAPGAASRPRPVRPPPSAAMKAAAAKRAAEASSRASAEASANANVTHIQILSGDPGAGLRYNIMRLNSMREIDPAALPRPVLMNRKQPGPKLLPTFVHDEEGNIVGRYVFDEDGKPVLDADGKPTIEKKEGMDLSLVGRAAGQSHRRRGKRNTREVFHQDIEKIKLRREEANPWVLESKNPSEKPAQPETWVGRFVEPSSSMVPVLLVNEGEGASFTMVPLGRTYNFQSKRPFKVMDADEANTYFKAQEKHKVHDRWSQRQEGGADSSAAARPKRAGISALEARAQRMEMNARMSRGQGDMRMGRRERYEDDYVREQRQLGRGLDGGADEELDYDVNEEFQDDEDKNTFYHNKEEEEEKKHQEEKQQREFRMANANFGDRAQIDVDEDDDDDDLFGEKLTTEGKRLRKVMRRRGGEDDLYDSSEDDSDSEEEEREKEKEKEKKPDAPGSAERPSRPMSRAGSRPPGSASGSPSRPGASDRPLPASVALLAKRGASRGASPHGSRAGSPLARGASPDLGRSGSPGMNGRSGSPALGRGSSPAGGREGTPGAGGVPPRPKSKSAKRKATSQSPLADAPPSEPGSPAYSETASPAAGSDAEPKKKKKKSRASGSATPIPEDESFPGMITGEEVLSWLQAQPEKIPMQAAVAMFTDRMRRTDTQKRNQELFLHWIRRFTTRNKEQFLELKPEYKLDR